MSLVVGLAMVALALGLGAAMVAPKLAARRKHTAPWMLVGKRVGLVVHEEHNALLQETRITLRGVFEGVPMSLLGEEDGNLLLHTELEPALGPGLDLSWNAGPMHFFGGMREVPVGMLAHALPGLRVVAVDALGAESLLRGAAAALAVSHPVLKGVALGDRGVALHLRGPLTEATLREAVGMLARIVHALRTSAEAAGTKPWGEVFRARWRSAGVAFEGPDASYRATAEALDRGTHEGRTFTVETDAKRARVKLRLPLQGVQLPEGWLLAAENDLRAQMASTFLPPGVRKTSLGVPTASPLFVVAPSDARGPALSVLQGVLAACPRGLTQVAPEGGELVFTMEACMVEDLLPWLHLSVSLVSVIEGRK